MFAEEGTLLSLAMSQVITFGSLPVIRKYVYGLHSAEVLKQALYKCAELRMKSSLLAYQMFYERIFKVKPKYEV